MINHARTLLANLSPLNSFSIAAYMAEEIIDPSFRPVDLPGYLVRTRESLFGQAPDRDMVNYRCRQLMTLLHGTPLVDHVTAFDSRITYLFGTTPEEGIILNDVFLPVVTAMDGTVGTLSLFGSPSAPDEMGKVLLSYVVEDLGGSATVSLFGNTSVTVPYTTSGRLSSPIPLPRSGYFARLPDSGPGSSWLVEIRNRPQNSLADLLDHLGSVGEATIENLFKLGSAEPFKTYWNLWRLQPELPLKLAGVVMALVHGTEEARRGSSAAS